MEEERLEIKKIQKARKKNLALIISFDVLANLSFFASGMSFRQVIMGNDQKKFAIYGILLIIIGLLSRSKNIDYAAKRKNLRLEK